VLLLCGLFTCCISVNALQGQSQGLAAQWAEEVSLDVSPEGLAAADALLLLEVVQLPSGFARFKVGVTAITFDSTRHTSHYVTLYSQSALQHASNF
jgi:hypothetical protein